MKNTIRYIKSLFGKYETGYEYWVRLDEIKVSEDCRLTRIGTKKWLRKKRYYEATGKFESIIVLDKDFNLIDGYSSIRLAELNHIKKVPAYFVD